MKNGKGRVKLQGKSAKKTKNYGACGFHPTHLVDVEGGGFGTKSEMWLVANNLSFWNPMDQSDPDYLKREH
jgi:hypothetical protein